jgi:argininosuccinate lyase
VRDASRAGIRGLDLTADMINQAARKRTGASWGLLDADLQAVLDPAQIVASRQAVGGAAREAVEQMLETTSAEAAAIAAAAVARRDGFAAAEDALLARVRSVVAGERDRAPRGRAVRRGGSP